MKTASRELLLCALLCGIPVSCVNAANIAEEGELGIIEPEDSKIPALLDEAQRSTSDVFRLFYRALALHDLGRTAEAQRLLDELIARFPHSGAYQIAVAQTHFGQREKALDWLERAYAQRDGGLLHITNDPFLRNLRGEPRFIALLKKMNLPVD